MRSSLVVELVRAHMEGADKRFLEIVNQLAIDEERKGNGVVAKQLRESEQGAKRNKSSTSLTSSHMNAAGVTVPLPRAPKDRDSALDLVDWVYPDSLLSQLILSENVLSALNQIILENKNIERLKSLKLYPTKRLLLFGPPGCGKTSIAFALASELRRPLAYVRLDALISSFLGQTGTNIRRVFDAVKDTNSILFLDEFDSIGKRRDDAQELGELKRVVTTLLQNFDLLTGDEFIIAATNHEHLLDEAIWRRFDSTVLVDLPNSIQREELLKISLEKYPLGRINWRLLVDASTDMNCAVITETCMKAVKRTLVYEEKEKVETDDVSVLFINHLMLSNDIKFGDLNSGNLLFAKKLRERGFSIRAVSKALGVARSTLSDYLKEAGTHEQ